jgi:transposase
VCCIHADDMTVPVLAKGKIRTGRLWTCVRDDRRFGGVTRRRPAFFYSTDREARGPEQQLASYVGLMQADAHSKRRFQAASLGACEVR